MIFFSPKHIPAKKRTVINGANSSTPSLKRQNFERKYVKETVESVIKRVSKILLNQLKTFFLNFNSSFKPTP